MINIKNLLILSFIFTTSWSALSDVTFNNWTNLNDTQCSFLSGVFSYEDTIVKVVEGKINGEGKNMNYIVVFNRPDEEDCLYVYNYNSENQEQPYTQLNLGSDNVNKLLQYVPGLKLCDSDAVNQIFEIPLKKFKRTIDYIKIGHLEKPLISKTVQQLKPGVVQMISKNGGWMPMVQDDIGSLSQTLAIEEQNLQIVGGVYQVVSGLNYVISVVPKDDQEATPCVISFNLRAWDTENKITGISSENTESAMSSGSLAGLSPCDSEMETQTISNLNNHLLVYMSSNTVKNNDLEVGSWNQVDPASIPMIENSLNFKDFGLSFEKTPLVQNLMKTRFAMAIKDSEDGKCYFFLTLNNTLEVIKFELIENNKALMKTGQQLFNTTMPCPRDFLIAMLAKLNVNEAYIGMFKSLYMSIQNELANMKNSLGSKWKVMTNENIVSARKELKTKNKTLKPMAGLMNFEENSQYIFIMLDNFKLPCTMYMSTTHKIGFNSTLKNLSELEEYSSFLTDVDPCDSDLFQEYIENRIRLLI